MEEDRTSLEEAQKTLINLCKVEPKSYFINGPEPFESYKKRIRLLFKSALEFQYEYENKLAAKERIKNFHFDVV